MTRRYERVPCRGCGGKKPPEGRGIYCVPCRTKYYRARDARKPCSKCGGVKGPGMGRTLCARCLIQNRPTVDGDRDVKARLPALPLALAIERCAASYRAKSNYWNLAGVSLPGIEPVCKRAGISVRQVFRWQVGENPTINLYRAIEIMDRLNLTWWDVWTEESMRVPVFTVRVYGKPQTKHSRGRPSVGPRRHLCQSVRYGDLGPDLEGLKAVRTEMQRTEPAQRMAA